MLYAKVASPIAGQQRAGRPVRPMGAPLRAQARQGGGAQSIVRGAAAANLGMKGRQGVRLGPVRVATLHACVWVCARSRPTSLPPQRSRLQGALPYLFLPCFSPGPSGWAGSQPRRRQAPPACVTHRPYTTARRPPPHKQGSLYLDTTVCLHRCPLTLHHPSPRAGAPCSSPLSPCRALATAPRRQRALPTPSSSAPCLGAAAIASLALAPRPPVSVRGCGWASPRLTRCPPGAGLAEPARMSTMRRGRNAKCAVVPGRRKERQLRSRPSTWQRSRGGGVAAVRNRRLTLTAARAGAPRPSTCATWPTAAMHVTTRTTWSARRPCQPPSGSVPRAMPPTGCRGV